MSVDGLWWFYKVDAEKFEAVQSEFEQAANGVPNLPKVPDLPPRPQVTPGTQESTNLWLEGVTMGNELGLQLHHKSFEAIAYRIVEEEEPLSCNDESCIEAVMQNRVLPTTILLVGIGNKRFSQLPGHLGNMLIDPQEIEKTIELVAHILDVNWEIYFERAKRVLTYAGDDERAARDVTKILHAIPNALKRVKDKGAGLLALTSWGCP